MADKPADSSPEPESDTETIDSDKFVGGDEEATASLGMMKLSEDPEDPDAPDFEVIATGEDYRPPEK